ncbi:MAG: LysR family transcriptional regulator [Pseudomonadota bacterium]
MLYRDIRRLDLNLLVVLDALYKERSVTRAAERLTLTQPTVSGMLRRLREIFDDELYLRSSHGVVPTPRAEALAGQVAEILESANALLVPEAFDPAETEFSLTFCGSDYLLQTLLGALAADVIASAPGARVTLLARPTGVYAKQNDEIDAQLARGEIDLLVSIGDGAMAEMPGMTLYHEGLVCASSYAAHRPGQRVELSELCALNHIILGPADTPIRRYIDERLSAAGLERNIAVSVPNFATVFNAMHHGEFIAFMPAKIADLNGGFLTRLETDLSIPSANVVANWHPRMTKDPRHIWLRSKLMAYGGGNS